MARHEKLLERLRSRPKDFRWEQLKTLLGRFGYEEEKGSVVKGFLEHKGYIGSVRFNAEDDVFGGKLQGIRDLVTYEGTDVASLKQSFYEAVDDYLETCKRRGKTPEQPYKGSFNVRVGRELHKRAAVFAAEHKKKLNSVVSDALEKYLETAACGD